jgi:UDP-N-acetylmuramoyl-L-alanyl-D-glutamate--2,6-diaminopimelate ligase
VFGCGGDRDTGKRPLMGKAASEWADIAILTDDNPRTEEPTAIRQAVRAGMTGRALCHEIGDRAQAIAAAIAEAKPGDVVVIAGKGHEKEQIIGTDKFHFDDAEVARDLCRPVAMA